MGKGLTLFARGFLMLHGTSTYSVTVHLKFRSNMAFTGVSTSRCHLRDMTYRSTGTHDTQGWTYAKGPSSPCRERLDPLSGRQRAPVSAKPPVSGPAGAAAAALKILVMSRAGTRSFERAQLETA